MAARMRSGSVPTRLFQPQSTVINGNADAPAGATPRLFPFTLTSQDPVFKIPVAWNWNATFQREIGWGTTIEVGYVGRRGIHNQRKRNLNQLLPGTVQANPGINVNALRPFLGLGILGLAENSGLSQYHGMQISLERRQRDVDDRRIDKRHARPKDRRGQGPGLR